MEKCDLCGKETPIMQLGVRYCFKCGESVIRVCRACDASPFYCKSCKRKKGKGWHEPPDASGKAPDHRDAKLRAQAKHAQNTPMGKKDVLLYRVEEDGKYHLDADGSGRFGLPFSSYEKMRKAIKRKFKLKKVGNGKRRKQ